MTARAWTRRFASVMICLALSMAGCPSDDDEASNTGAADGGSEKRAADSSTDEPEADSAVAASDAGDGTVHAGHDASTGGSEKDASIGGGEKDSGGTSEGGGAVTFKAGDASVDAMTCDYIGRHPGDTTGSVYGTTFLCRMGVGGLPSIGISFPEDTADGATVACGSPKVAMTLGNTDSSVYSSTSGTCSVTVTTHGAGAGDKLTGSFSATLKRLAGTGPDTIEITDGAFDLTRVD